MVGGKSCFNLLGEENAEMLFHPQAWFLSQARRTGLCPWGHLLTFLRSRRSPGDPLSLHLSRGRRGKQGRTESGRGGPTARGRPGAAVLTAGFSGPSCPFVWNLPSVAPCSSGRAGRQGQRLRQLPLSLAVGRALALPGESLSCKARGPGYFESISAVTFKSRCF